MLVLFVLWERYLENTHASGDEALRQRWWTPPPLMPVSIWVRAKGKLAVLVMIAFLEWASFNSFTFWIQVRFALAYVWKLTVTHAYVPQLYYQDYVHLSPILTMVRLLPMTVTGVLCNVIVALVIGHIDVVILIGTCSLICLHTYLALITPNSNRYTLHRTCEPPLRGDRPLRAVLGLRLPRHDPLRLRR